jgi:peptidoglycan/LPS O-acetylase OafA/YrhL
VWVRPVECRTGRRGALPGVPAEHLSRGAGAHGRGALRSRAAGYGCGVEVVLPFVVFGLFMAYFAMRARREGKSVDQWLRDQNAAARYSPGWWKPAAIWVACLVAFFIAYVSFDRGFRWQYLLVIPIFGAVFAVGTAALTVFFKRQFRP